MFGLVTDRHLQDVKEMAEQRVAAIERIGVELRAQIAMLEKQVEQMRQERDDCKIERDEAVAKLMQLLAEGSGQYQVPDTEEAAPPSNLPRAEVDLEPDPNFGVPRGVMLRRPGIFSRVATLRNTVRYNRSQVESSLSAIDAEVKRRVDDVMNNSEGVREATV